MSAQVWSVGSEKYNFPRGLSKGLTEMASKDNSDVNIVNYLITHKSTIGADTAMSDISFLRQSWGEGKWLWKTFGKFPPCQGKTNKQTHQ